MAGNRIVAIIKRLFRLWRVYAYLDFMWMTRDLRYFLIIAISDVMMTLGMITGMLLLAERFNGIGAWSKDEMLFLLGYSSLVRGFINVFFGFNIFHISRRVGRGQLDHTLIIQQPLWLSFLTEGFTPCQSSLTLFPGIVLLVWSSHQLHLHIGAGWLASLGVQLLSSTVLMIAFAFLCGSVAFWAPRAGEEINSSIDRAIEGLKVFPLDGVGPLLLTGLTTVFPIAFLSWYPSRILLGIEHHPWGSWLTPLVAGICATLAAGIFSRGLRYYVNTGSQRYYDRGHRS